MTYYLLDAQTGAQTSVEGEFIQYDFEHFHYKGEECEFDTFGANVQFLRNVKGDIRQDVLVFRNSSDIKNITEFLSKRKDWAIQSLTANVEKLIRAI